MAAANRHYWQHEGRGKGVSCQLWNIRDKIREVDEAMTPERQATIGEAHPELIFWNLAGQRRLDRKTSARGREQRIEILTKQGFARLPTWLTQRHGTGIGRDDLIDACACAVAARDSRQRLDGEDPDPRGLRMEINY
jgi:predicted RNase H-like nuclease